MQTVMGVLEALKINNTLWIQFGCFLVAYLALSNFIFKPYLAAYKKRKESTVGGEELAEQVKKETEELSARYEAKAKEVNAEYKKIYDAKRTEAVKEYESMVSGARKEAQSTQEKMSEQISKELKSAKEEINSEISSVSIAMASKLVGKEISQ